MKGQWIGSCTGTNTGLVVLNVDELQSCYQGWAYLLDNNSLIPGSAIFFKTENKNKDFKFHTKIVLPIDRNTGIVVQWDNVKHLYQEGVRMPDYVDVTGSHDNESMKVLWTTNIGTTATGTLQRSRADKPSELVADQKEWTSYKEYVSPFSKEGRKFLFRGQNNLGRLRTAFHRTGRADLHRFLNEDVQVLHKHLSARTKHIFNLAIPNENGAFFNLIQHHGYPTPLLDWTYSPYVAAFFAYRHITNEMAEKADPKAKVRIHIFDQALWKANMLTEVMLLTTRPHVSISEFIAIENERMIPQQAASTVTNLDDIESYIKLQEKDGKKYLWAIDLPVRERKKVIQELSYMGITAGSLFPGLDGACEELKERNFEL